MPIPSDHSRPEVSMKRSFAIILAVVGSSVLFAGVVYAVLVIAHAAESAAVTVYGPTPRRLWATAVAVLGLGGVVIGGLALARPVTRYSIGSGSFGAIAALVLGLIAAV